MRLIRVEWFRARGDKRSIPEELPLNLNGRVGGFLRESEPAQAENMKTGNSELTRD